MNSSDGAQTMRSREAFENRSRAVRTIVFDDLHHPRLDPDGNATSYDATTMLPLCCHNAATMLLQCSRTMGQINREQFTVQQSAASTAVCVPHSLSLFILSNRLAA